MKFEFTALDQLTLEEIELLFGESVAFARPSTVAQQVHLQGMATHSMNGAEFYEVEDLLA